MPTRSRRPAGDSSQFPAPPRDLEGLRTLAAGIGGLESGLSLGGKAHAVLAHLVDLPEQAAVHTISELGQMLGVNASTLTRLAKKLGYAGFTDFQDVFRRTVADSERYFYSRRAGRMLADDEQCAGGPLGTFSRLARESVANIEGALARLEPDSALGAAELLASAPRVRVHGVRQFQALASFLTYGLGMLRSDVAMLDASRLGVAEALAQLGAGDAVVVASCAPYTRSVINAAQAAAEQGLAVVAITDARSSPLVAPSRYAFFIPHASSFYSNSMGAFVVFSEALLNLVALRLADAALSALARREELIRRMKVETG